MAKAVANSSNITSKAEKCRMVEDERRLIELDNAECQWWRKVMSEILVGCEDTATANVGTKLMRDPWTPMIRGDFFEMHQRANFKCWGILLSSQAQITDGLNQGSSGEQGSSPELIWRNRSILPRTIKTESSPIHRRNMFFQWRSVGEQSI